MTYELRFDPRALKEWGKLGEPIRRQFKNKLGEILECPHIEANKLKGLSSCYKIKLRSSGYRMVYQVQEQKVTVFVVAVGKRERKQVYSSAKNRL